MSMRDGFEIIGFLEREPRTGDYVLVGNPASGWFGRVTDESPSTHPEDWITVVHLGGPRQEQCEFVQVGQCWAVDVLECKTIHASREVA